MTERLRQVDWCTVWDRCQASKASSASIILPGTEYANEDGQDQPIDSYHILTPNKRIPGQTKQTIASTRSNEEKKKRTQKEVIQQYLHHLERVQESINLRIDADKDDGQDKDPPRVESKEEMGDIAKETNHNNEDGKRIEEKKENEKSSPLQLAFEARDANRFLAEIFGVPVGDEHEDDRIQNATETMGEEDPCDCVNCQEAELDIADKGKDAVGVGVKGAADAVHGVVGIMDETKRDEAELEEKESKGDVSGEDAEVQQESDVKIEDIDHVMASEGNRLSADKSETVLSSASVTTLKPLFEVTSKISYDLEVSQKPSVGAVEEVVECQVETEDKETQVTFCWIHNSLNANVKTAKAPRLRIGTDKSGHEAMIDNGKKGVRRRLGLVAASIGHLVMKRQKQDVLQPLVTVQA